VFADDLCPVYGYNEGLLGKSLKNDAINPQIRLKFDLHFKESKKNTIFMDIISGSN
jgi:hypothetical protein